MKTTSRIFSLILTGAISAAASSLILQNNYIKAGVSDNGTFGWGGSTRPGMMYDITGTGDFATAEDYDYLIPGSPWEMFAVNYTKGGDRIHRTNNNAGGDNMPDTTITGDTSSVTAVTHEGNLDITQVYSLAAGAKSILINVTLTNVSDVALEDVKYARGIDPDQDALTYDAFTTHNLRGVTLGGTTISPEDIVYALGVNSELPLSLYSADATPHNTSIAYWSDNPDTIYTGIDDGDGDYTIGMAFDLGTINAGESRSFTYRYLFGNSLDEAVEETTDDEEEIADVEMSGACSAKVISFSTLMGDGTVTKEVTLKNTGDYALKTLQLKITHNEESHYNVTPSGANPCNLKGTLAPGEECTMAVSYYTTIVPRTVKGSDLFYMGTYSNESGDKMYVKESCNIISETLVNP